MRNHFFVLTVLAVTFWTGRGDQTQIGPRTVGQREDAAQSLDSSTILSQLQELIERMIALKLRKESGMDGIHDKSTRDDFYLDDLAEGSGWSSDDVESEWDSSMSEYNEDYYEGSSGEEPSQETVYGSLHLNKVFKKEYLDSSSVEYATLETNFIMSMRETMENSPLESNYLQTFVLGFSPGSVQVDFGIQLQNFGDNPEIVIQESVSQIINNGISRGKFGNLSANASSLVISVSPRQPEETTTPSRTNAKNTEPAGNNNMMTSDKNVYRGDGDDEVNKEEKEKDIIEMILGDPIIIAAIVGGIIVILLSVILLFLFVVYRLKKKDEGSYSLDEPAKSKDPTAYWKETKEFYA